PAELAFEHERDVLSRLLVHAGHPGDFDGPRRKHPAAVEDVGGTVVGRPKPDRAESSPAREEGRLPDVARETGQVPQAVALDAQARTPERPRLVAHPQRSA